MVVVAVVGAAVIIGTPAGSSSASPTCTDNWTGGAEDGLWNSAGNWSTASVPGSSDVACIGSGATVEIAGGSNEIAALVDEGKLVIASGSLELLDGPGDEPSVAHSLSLTGGELVLAGELDVQNSFTVSGQVALRGAGKLVMNSGTTSTIGSNCGSVILEGLTVVNEGTITFGSIGGTEDGAIAMSDGAKLQNAGTFNDDSYDPGCGYGYGGTSFYRGGGETPTVSNTGTFTTHGGTNTFQIEVPFNNEGSVEADTSELSFGRGGITEDFAKGTWSTSGGGMIVLRGGTFLIAASVDLSEVTVSGATVTRGSLPASSSPPTVSGQAMATATLTASLGSWTGLPSPSFSYSWQDCNSSGEECSAIVGATSNDYTLASGDIGKTVKASVTGTNVEGSATAASTHTPVVEAASQPFNTTAPSFSGSASDGQTLSAKPGVWGGLEPISYKYQWQSCDGDGGKCSDIESAKSSDYTISSGDVESAVRVIVTATDTLGSTQATSATSSAVTSGPPRELVAPTVLGSPNVDQPLSANPGTWGGTGIELSYQWERCDAAGTECHDLDGATEPAYVPGEGDSGDTLRVRIGAKNELGSVTALSPATAVVSAASLTLENNTEPSLSGIDQSGDVLTVSPGAWTGVEPIIYTYAWERCDPDGSECEERWGVHGSGYVLEEEDIGHTIRALVTSTDANGSLTQAVNTEQPIAAQPGPLDSEAPNVAGQPTDGETLQASSGVWSGSGPIAYTYQWVLRQEDGESCTPIEGATSTSYTLTEADVGSALRVLVTATDEAGRSIGLSQPTPTIGTAAPQSAAPLQSPAQARLGSPWTRPRESGAVKGPSLLPINGSAVTKKAPAAPTSRTQPKAHMSQRKATQAKR